MATAGQWLNLPTEGVAAGKLVRELSVWSRPSGVQGQARS